MKDARFFDSVVSIPGLAFLLSRYFSYTLLLWYFHICIHIVVLYHPLDGLSLPVNVK